MGTRRLTLLRHGKAQSIDACAEDFERALTRRGYGRGRTRGPSTHHQDVEPFVGQTPQRVLTPKPVHRPSLPHRVRGTSRVGKATRVHARGGVGQPVRAGKPRGTMG